MKINELDQYDFVETFGGLITGVLNNLGIKKTASHYDDCYQIALIKLFQAADDYPGDLLDEEGLYQFSGYAFTRIKWAVLDECRRMNRIGQREEDLPETYQELDVFGDKGIEDQLIDQIDLAHFIQWLDDREVLYMNLFYKHGQIAKVASIMGLSRKTIYKIRKTIANKYLRFLEGR